MNAAVCHRLFYALHPSPSARCVIDRLSQRLGAGDRLRPEHLHLTLAITEDYSAPPRALMDRMVRIPETLPLMAFQLTLDRLRGSERSLALCPTAGSWRLSLLQLQLQKALARSGIRRDCWRFSAHMTLLYRHGIGFSSAIAPISWWAEELVLVHSHVGLTRHDIVGRWPLLPGGGASLAA